MARNVIDPAGGASLVVTDGAIKTPLQTEADDFTVSAEDTGRTFYVTGSDKTATLPSVADGLIFKFVSGNTGSSTGLSISPAAADKIIGAGGAGTDNKDLINTTGTAALGDSVTLVGDETAGGWVVTDRTGTWAHEA